MRKTLILMVIILFGITLLWVAVKNHIPEFVKYKSMCELYPEECKESKLIGLGEETISENGRKYKVIAEAKSTFNLTWMQFMDSALPGVELDGKCDFAMFFMLKADGYLYGNSFSCAEGTSIIKQQCKNEGIEYDDYVHKAKG